MTGVYQHFDTIVARAEARSSTWEIIFRKAITIAELQTAIRQCNVIEGRERCARYVRNAFVGEPIGFMLETVLSYIPVSKPVHRWKTPEWILEVVCREFGVRDVALLRSPGRQQTLVAARSAAAHFLYVEYQLTLIAIAQLLGRTDHSTMIHALEGYDRRIVSDGAFQQKTEIIQNHIAFAKSIP